MSSLNEVNDRLGDQPFLGGYTPSKEDAAAYAEMFGNSTAAAQWAARMACYYEAERAELTAAKKAEKK